MQGIDSPTPGNGQSHSHRSEEPASDLRELIGTLLSRAWLIAVCVIVALLGAAIYYKQAPRIYQATATVQVEQEEQRVVKVEQVVKEDLRALEVMNTIVQKLRSQPLLEQVLETNGVTDAQKLFGPATKIDPEAPKPSVEGMAQALAGMVKTSLRRNTRLIDVTVSHPDPKLAARFANSVVEQYMTQDSKVRSSSTKGAFSFLKEESERLKKKLEASEGALQAYREQVGSMSMVQGSDIVMPQLRDLSLRVSQAKTDSVRLKAAYDQVVASQSNVMAMLTAPQIATDLSVTDARSLVTRLENDFSLIQQRYKGKHPKYVQASTTLDEARRGLTNAVYKAVDTLKVAYENAVATEKGMDQTFNSAQDGALKLSQQSIRYNLLAREVESDRALFDSVLNRLKETSLTTDIAPEKIRVVDPATVPSGPASPKLKIVFGLALIGGLMLGCMMAFGLAALDTSFKGVDEAEHYLKLPVLCTMPKLKEVKKNQNQLVATEGRKSLGAEAFRTLRSALSMLGREQERRSFLFTSSLPQEGKSFSSINYAASLAQQGHRTLLVDADLRRPSIEDYLVGDRKSDEDLAGLTDLLVGRKQLSEVALPVESVENLFWVPAGELAPNPAELLSGERFGEVLAELLQKYDRVVIDSAPVHAVSDTLMIAAKVQTTVLVINGSKTPRRVAARCVHLLQKSGAKLGGTVLNLLARGHGRGYGYYGYYYYSSYYYYGGKGYYGKDKEKKSDRKRKSRSSEETRPEGTERTEETEQSRK